MGRQAPPTSSYTPSTLPADWKLVELGAPQGSNAFLCVDDAGEERLVEMGSKLRRMVYASRGSFAMVQLYPSAEGETESARLAGEIMSVVTAEEMKQWKRAGEWPKAFSKPPVARAAPARRATPDSGSESDNAPVPVRRRVLAMPPSDSESE